MSDQHHHQGIFGGTFDPVHLGHIDTVIEVANSGRLDLVRMIPASVPPHRPQPTASAVHRMEMVKLAIADHPGLMADSCEIDRVGASYTVDTIDALVGAFPNSRFSLIIGLDALLSFDRWYQWQSILNQVSLLVMARPGYQLPVAKLDWINPEALFQYETLANISSRSFNEAGKIHLIPVSPVDISATLIRQRLKAGEDVSAILHPDVWQYIDQHKLYV